MLQHLLQNRKIISLQLEACKKTEHSHKLAVLQKLLLSLAVYKGTHQNIGNFLDQGQVLAFLVLHIVVPADEVYHSENAIEKDLLN